MPRWPIRLKLMVGLSLVVGMILILLGGSTFGLHSFHISNLTHRRPVARDRRVDEALRGRASDCTRRATARRPRIGAT